MKATQGLPSSQGVLFMLAHLRRMREKESEKGVHTAQDSPFPYSTKESRKHVKKSSPHFRACNNTRPSLRTPILKSRICICRAIPLLDAVVPIRILQVTFNSYAEVVLHKIKTNYFLIIFSTVLMINLVIILMCFGLCLHVLAKRAANEEERIVGQMLVSEDFDMPADD